MGVNCVLVVGVVRRDIITVVFNGGTKKESSLELCTDVSLGASHGDMVMADPAPGRAFRSLIDSCSDFLDSPNHLSHRTLATVTMI